MYWVDINLALKKGLKFYQTRSNAIILHETLPACCIPKVVRMETGEVIYEKVFASPRPPPEISSKHDWMKELVQAKGSQPTQPNPNPNHDRTERPVVCPQGGAPRSQEIETRSLREEAENHDRTGRPVVCPQAGASQTRCSHMKQNTIERGKPVVCRDANHERSMLNEVDIDFRIPGLPHSVVKEAENYRVRELVKQIENHPHRQSLQRDLQQNNANTPFNERSKKMMGNAELFELFETDPKTQCKEWLLYWIQGIVYCTCGHLLKESEASRGAIQCTLDLLSIQNSVIKKGRLHGHRYGKTTEQRDHRIAHHFRKRCIKRRFKRDPRSLFERS